MPFLWLSERHIFMNPRDTCTPVDDGSSEGMGHTVSSDCCPSLLFLVDCCGSRGPMDGPVLPCRESGLTCRERAYAQTTGLGVNSLAALWHRWERSWMALRARRRTPSPSGLLPNGHVVFLSVPLSLPASFFPPSPFPPPLFLSEL